MQWCQHQLCYHQLVEWLKLKNCCHWKKTEKHDYNTIHAHTRAHTHTHTHTHTAHFNLPIFEEEDFDTKDAALNWWCVLSVLLRFTEGLLEVVIDGNELIDAVDDTTYPSSVDDFAESGNCLCWPGKLATMLLAEEDDDTGLSLVTLVCCWSGNFATMFLWCFEDVGGLPPELGGVGVPQADLLLTYAAQSKGQKYF